MEGNIMGIPWPPCVPHRVVSWLLRFQWWKLPFHDKNSRNRSKNGSFTLTDIDFSYSQSSTCKYTISIENIEQIKPVFGDTIVSIKLSKEVFQIFCTISVSNFKHLQLAAIVSKCMPLMGHYFMMSHVWLLAKNWGWIIKNRDSHYHNLTADFQWCE